MDGHIDFVTAVLSGSSRLLLVDMVPIPGANVELADSCAANLNLMDGATLTGSIDRSSQLDYHGSNIRQEVTVNDTASVNRLGNSRA